MDRARRSASPARPRPPRSLASVTIADAGRPVRIAARWRSAGRPRRSLVCEVADRRRVGIRRVRRARERGRRAVDLAGPEVVYATSTGSTVTRKATWTATPILDPGRPPPHRERRRGRSRRSRDATYSGGFAATGGAVVLRAIGGAPIDALGWGDATNAFVEGSAAPAPPAGSSIERLPGGPSGQPTDTNDNALDWFVLASPSPQNLAAPPAPTPAPAPTPSRRPRRRPPSPTPSTPTPTPSTPTPTPSPPPTADPHADGDADTDPSHPRRRPRQTPCPTPTPARRPRRRRRPTARAGSRAEPTPVPSPSRPRPRPVADRRPSIADVRALPDGATATIEGVLTTDLGALECGRTGFVQDATGGIALYLDAALAGGPLAAGTGPRHRDARRPLRPADPPGRRCESSSSAGRGPARRRRPCDRRRRRGARRFAASRRGVVGAPSALTDGLAVTIDDGIGPVRVVVGAGALGAARPRAAIGRRRDRAARPARQLGHGPDGYRVHATRPGIRGRHAA